MSKSKRAALSTTKQSGAPIVRKNSKSLGLLRSITAWESPPLNPPKVEGGFSQMSIPGKTLETLRYMLFLLEYKIAPNGWFRAWLVLWIRLFLLFVIPTIAVVLIVQVAVPLFEGLAEIAGSLERTMRSGFYALVWLILSTMLIAAAIQGVRVYLRSRKKRTKIMRKRRV
jgi:hypothetical protein